MTVHSSRWRRRSGAEGDMSLQWFGRYGNAREHTLDDVVRGHVLRERFERKDDAMPYDIEREILDVLPGDVAATAEVRQRATSQDEVDRCARARAVADVLGDVADAVLGRVARSGREPDDILHKRRIDEDVVDFVLELDQTLGGHHRDDRRHAAGHPLND